MAVEGRYRNWEYIPEGSYDEVEGGIVYQWEDFLNVAKGNEKLAMLLIDTCDWQYPETEIEQLLDIEEIAERDGSYIMLYDDDVLKQLWSEFGDVLIDYDNPDYPDGIIENDWLVFEAGTERMEIWGWFDERYTGGVYKLMFPNG